MYTDTSKVYIFNNHIKGKEITITIGEHTLKVHLTGIGNSVVVSFTAIIAGLNLG